MLEQCQFCGTTKVVQGPRNKRVMGYCGSAGCRVKALIALEEMDMLDEAERAELAAARGG